ncbi:hypothetical protein [Fluviicola sp.]|jgi:hypothetical protein|uniref:hypothetical protein n=1 Tax=Fluviicola sp. TaxID=1917219 RepID=UPI002633ECA7|nr:hypothetical protein [Fluviicola sp.]
MPNFGPIEVGLKPLPLEGDREGGKEDYWKPTDFIFPIFNKLPSMVISTSGNDV